jgi:excisionase family DNA binding protein
MPIKKNPQRTPLRLYSVAETADMLGVSVACIREWVWRRRIPVHRVGRHVRIADATIDKLLTEGYVPADRRLAIVQ